MSEPSWADLEPVEQNLPAAIEALERSYVRAFSTNDGAAVLAHLRATFLDRRLGPDCSDAHLRHAEAARSVVDHILSAIKRGQRK